MIIRKALYSDLDNVLFVERAAFGSDEEANLVRDLLGDDSAKPIVSLLAFQENRAVWHILFTKACIESKAPLSISILAPLAVGPVRGTSYNPSVKHKVCVFNKLIKSIR